MIPKDRFEFFQTRLLAAARVKAGSWNKLAAELPLSPSHLLGLRNGKICLGGESFVRLIHYLDLYDKLSQLVDFEGPCED
jgi:hypothetical protein